LGHCLFSHARARAPDGPRGDRVRLWAPRRRQCDACEFPLLELPLWQRVLLRGRWAPPNVCEWPNAEACWQRFRWHEWKRDGVPLFKHVQ
jgi:hypothetical protein